MDYDFTGLSREDIFQIDTKRKPRERVATEFKRIYSLSPLDILTRAEEAESLKKAGMELQDLCGKHFTFQEYAFLIEQLGENFGSKLRMPLEFRDFTNGDLERYFLGNMEKFQSRLEILMENAPIDGNGRFNKDLLNNPFVLVSKENILKIYDDVRNRKASYPARFFSKLNKRVARILVRHLIDKVLQLPHDKVLVDVNKETFSKNKLGLLLDICYEGAINPVYTAVRDAYPERTFPDIYKPNYKPTDPVKSLIERLKAY